MSPAHDGGNGGILRFVAPAFNHDRINGGIAMATPHYIPETARLFLIRQRPHHALAAVIALAIMRSVVAVAGAAITALAILSI